MHQSRTRLALLAFTLFLAAVVYAADARLAEPVFEWIRSVPLADKLGHFAFTLVLSALAIRAFPSAGVRIGSKQIPVAFIVVAVVVLAEEIWQRWFPTRTFSYGDLSADALGLFCGLLIAMRNRAM